MRPKFPIPVEHLLASLNKLPGVGPKTALRYMYAILRWQNQDRAGLASALLELNATLLTCTKCHTLSDVNPCAICADTKRDMTTICIVAEPQDLLAIESTAMYNGRYYVLGAVISPLDGVRPEDLNTRPLLDRIGNEGIREIILAFDPDAEGETTTLFLTKLLKHQPVIVSRLGRGIPVGGDLEYADTLTLRDALSGRKIL
jgi:recombination protein RecR